jgi:hypothetical protein
VRDVISHDLEKIGAPAPLQRSPEQIPATSISLLPFTWVSRNGWTCGVRRARNPEKHLLFARDREFDSTSL